MSEGLKSQIEALFTETFKDSYGEEWLIYDSNLRDKVLAVVDAWAEGNTIIDKKQLEDLWKERPKITFSENRGYGGYLGILEDFYNWLQKAEKVLGVEG